MSSHGPLLLLLCAACAACAAAHPPPLPAAPPVYPEPERIQLPVGDFLWRQHVEARHGDQSGGFDAVLQKRGDEILMIGLTPFGTKAFELSRVGGVVHFKSDLPRELPFSPQYIFDDVARTYFAGLPGSPLADGTHTLDGTGERTTELWQNGRLMRRSFVRLASDPPGEIRIDYIDGMLGAHSARVIEFDNGWLGYHLTITTVSEQSL